MRKIVLIATMQFFLFGCEDSGRTDPTGLVDVGTFYREATDEELVKVQRGEDIYLSNQLHNNKYIPLNYELLGYHTSGSLNLDKEREKLNKHIENSCALALEQKNSDGSQIQVILINYTFSIDDVNEVERDSAYDCVKEVYVRH